MKLRYSITVDVDNTDIETLSEAINQYQFCMKYQTDKSFIRDLLDDIDTDNRNIDVEITSIEEI